jgi:hypothetical protein
LDGFEAGLERKAELERMWRALAEEFAALHAKLLRAGVSL